jgi:septal ring factor EnvC (AmiA/AmiB activator)
MRLRRVSWSLLVAGMLAAAVGCAHRPCPIIPAQLELAEDRLADAQAEYKSVSEEIDRLSGNIKRLETNIRKLEDEKAILLQLVGEEPTEEEEQ